MFHFYSNNCISFFKNHIDKFVTCNDKIIKIGGTKTGLKARIGSYHCGHYIRGQTRRGGGVVDGRCSVTNAYNYWTIKDRLETGNTIKIYFHPIPDTFMELDVYGEIQQVLVQTYDRFETIALNRYRDVIGQFPVLSDNSHPE